MTIFKAPPKMVALILILASFLAMLVFTSSAFAGWGLSQFSQAATNRNGSLDTQAGSHPYAFTTTFALTEPETITNSVYPNGRYVVQGGLKDARDELPPGFVGDPDATPKCNYVEFAKSGECPNDTAVGIAVFYFTDSGPPSASLEPLNLNNGMQFAENTVYNLEPSPGVAAEFGFKGDGFVPVILDASVRTGGDYGITVNVKNISQAIAVYATKITFWGVPAEASHDALRGSCLHEVSDASSIGILGLRPGETEQEVNEPLAESYGNCPVNIPVLPLLTNPTSCGVPRTAKFSVDSWQEPGNFETGENISSLSSPMPEITDCEKLDFSPTLSIVPDGTEGSTPTGLNVNVHVPQEATVNPSGLAEADVKDAKVTLPVGLDLDPSAADGLQACSLEQIKLHSPEAPSCPDASKVGTVEIDTPLLPEPLTGSVYLASPQNFANGALQNPFGSLIALYIVAENPTYGVLVKLAGQTIPNPVTGQLTTTFEETPQLPFSDLKLAFFGTDRAPLTTPPLCGTYNTGSVFTPWSATNPIEPVSSFAIASGPGGTPCQDPQPFSPGFVAGMTNLQAGAFSPFTLTMTRPDADQELGGVEMRMPPGLLGDLSGVKLCEEPQASLGTCGPESEIGSTVVSAGLGNDPVTVTGGKVYITTAYGGGNYGLSIVNPAKAGPFVLEEGRPVIVRAAIFVDPHTAALRVISGAVPTILDGIPLQLQHINVTIEREKFTFNPTSCDPMKLTGVLSSSQGATAAVSSPFQVTNCASLKFEPKLVVSTQSKTSKADGASLTFKLSRPDVQGTQADVLKLKVDLPKQLPSRLTTLQKACTAAQFNTNPAGCPAASVIGHMKVLTPILPVPLEGPLYFVSNGGEAFPNVIAVLEGYGITIDLVGDTFISKAGITSSTFNALPDAPFSSAEVVLPEGPHSALTTNLPETDHDNLCGQKLTMPTALVGQNGAEIHQDTPVTVTGCPKVVRHERKKTHKKKKKKTKAKGRAK